MAFSSISRCKVSILTSAVVTLCASVVSRLASASTESATCFSARPPISATMRARSCRSVSNAFIVWSVIGVIFRSGPDHALAEAPGDIILSAAILWSREDTGRFPELDELAEIHEGCEIRYARSLLHVVRHDCDRVVVLKFIHQFFDLGGRDRIKRRARLVKQDHLGLHGDGTGN